MDWLKQSLRLVMRFFLEAHVVFITYCIAFVIQPTSDTEQRFMY